MHLTESDKFEFQSLFPQMRILPSRGGARVYEGELSFVGESEEWGSVEDTYQLCIVVDPDPHALPQVQETTGRVARIDPSHVNPGPNGSRNGTLCLGSYLRLRMETGQPPTLVAFTKKCIVPYLYAMSLREQGKPAFVFGQLEHGVPGLLQDYEEILGVRGLSTVIKALRLTAKRRRVANKVLCPCGCGTRLGNCRVHHQVNALWRMAPRGYVATLTDGHRLTSPAAVR